VAAGWGGKEVDAWLTHDVKGAPPEGAGQSGPGISYFTPAMALKLIPTGPAHLVKVSSLTWQNGNTAHPKPVIFADISGDSIEQAWLEYQKEKKWIRVRRSLWKAPYVFTLDQSALPAGHVTLRVTALNIWEDTASSPSFSVEVAAAHDQTK
jgi:hypothetical protein